MKIFVTNDNAGSAFAMVPALLRLKSEGVEIVAFAEEVAPAFAVFKKAGFEPMAPRAPLGLDSMAAIINREKPDLIFVGVSDVDNGSEKMAIQVAAGASIPMVAIVESWPHKWLQNFASRDIPLYQKADAILVVDGIAKRKMVEAGFSSEQIVVTGNPGNDDLPVLRKELPRYRREMREKLGLSEEDFVFVYLLTNDLDNDEKWREEERNLRKEIGSLDPEWLGFQEKSVVKEFFAAVRDARHPNVEFRALIRQKRGYGRNKLDAVIKKFNPRAVVDTDGYLQGRATMLAADVVIGTTTLMMETAAFLGLPTVSYLPGVSIEKDPKPTNHLGITMPVREWGGLDKLIRSIAEQPAAVRELVRNKEALLPEDATGNVADFLRHFVV
ncbi:MAG: hypothetical protein Q8R12_02435 [bacterium]|nr:hypothetical protein [bacterium]